MGSASRDALRPRGVPLAARGVTFAYGRRQALHGVDLDVAPGEVVGLLGPNGSGKSTLLKVFSGVLPGYGGAVKVDGREVRETSRRELARRLAVVPQESAFGFPFTALEVTLMGRHPHLAGLAFEGESDLEIAGRALARCGAADLAERSIQELSSGERQRVVFARALAQEPRALLLDEPASFLDVRHQVELSELILELAHGEGVAVLMVLHDLGLAAALCDRAYLLQGGRVAAAGTPEEVFTPDHLARVFETELAVARDPETGTLRIAPAPRGPRVR